MSSSGQNHRTIQKREEGAQKMPMVREEGAKKMPMGKEKLTLPACNLK
jgi:hypothetical protein